jgi:hypothetical protein
MKRLISSVSGTPLSRVRLLLVLLVIVGCTLALMAPAPADARSCAWYARQVTYYDDANHDNVVGQTGLDCDCNDISWGVTSAYRSTSFQCCLHFTC